jgi:hypothetical protein
MAVFCYAEFMKEVKEFGLIFWLHLLTIILIWSSPFLVDWKLIALFILLYYLQLIAVGNCILTWKQFGAGKRQITFYYYYLSKLGLKLNVDRVRFVADYLLPWIILAMALFWQQVWGNEVLLGSLSF